VSRTLIARLDNVGDVLLAGPGVRAVAGAGRSVTFLAGRTGAEAARLLPGVERVITFDAPWVAFDAPPVDTSTIGEVISTIAAVEADDAIILTSFHQSPLPLALMMRMAGVSGIAATCVDFPGSLLDVRHPYLDDVHEVEQTLALCAASGYPLPPDDDRRLRIDLPGPELLPDVSGRPDSYVVVHPGASVPARGLPPGPTAEVVRALTRAGRHVVVTGTSGEVALARRIVAGARDDLVTLAVGATDLVGLAGWIAGADAVVCGNTGAAHIAAAVGTPVIEAFAPVVPAHRWYPWMVPHALLGRLDIACAGCRARRCPIAGQPCLQPFTVDTVLDALDRLARRPAPHPGQGRRVA
jgi:ADP-heptose:LPS heptosyltransferase